MRKIQLYGVAIAGAVCFVLVAAFRRPQPTSQTGSVRVVLRDSAGALIRHGSIFIDLGRGGINRVAANSSGTTILPVTAYERHGMRLLVCAEGILPFAPITGEDKVAEYDLQLLPYRGEGSRFVRSNGWYGPIPRECTHVADSVGWLVTFPGSTQRRIQYQEPDWSKP